MENLVIKEVRNFLLRPSIGACVWFYSSTETASHSAKADACLHNPMNGVLPVHWMMLIYIYIKTEKTF